MGQLHTHHPIYCKNIKKDKDKGKPANILHRQVGPLCDSGSGSRSNPRLDTMQMHWLVVPSSKALHTALLFSTQQQKGTCEGRFVSHSTRYKRLYTAKGVEKDIKVDIWIAKAQCPGKVLVKVCRADLWAWMWTEKEILSLPYNISDTFSPEYTKQSLNRLL